jgi:hypothetical protein
LSTKANQIDCVLLCRAAKKFGIANFVRPCSGNAWNCEQKVVGSVCSEKHCFCPAAKNFGVANKCTASVQPRSEKFGIYQQKVVGSVCSEKHWICLAAKNFWSCQQKHCIYSAAQREIWNLPTTQLKSTVVFLSAAQRSEIFGIATKSTVFCSAAQRKILELRTSTVFCPATQRKIVEVLTKNTVFCSVAAAKFLEL